MNLTMYQVDAFSPRVFGGNPAAIVPLAHWLPTETMQAIAAENNLSETAFFVRAGARHELRWFTPAAEVDLCGHATLASAWVIFHKLPDPPPTIAFDTRSGELRVTRAHDALTLDFPLQAPQPCTPPAALLPALGLAQAREVVCFADYIVVVDDPAQVAALAPDFAQLAGLPLRGVAVTAPGTDVDFVSRWFGPNVGVNEDPVTGSAHTQLAPYWANRLGKSTLTARQGGSRKGELTCTVAGARVFLTGSATLYLEGSISI
jgi:PhzF family phenazine biosynthesis protein